MPHITSLRKANPSHSITSEIYTTWHFRAEKFLGPFHRKTRTIPHFSQDLYGPENYSKLAAIIMPKTSSKTEKIVAESLLPLFGHLSQDVHGQGKAVLYENLFNSPFSWQNSI